MAVPTSRLGVVNISRQHGSLKKVAMEQLRDALYAKYGKEQRALGGDGGEWYFNEKHNPAPPPKIADPRKIDCRILIDEKINQRISDLSSYWRGQPLLLAKYLEDSKIMPVCGTVLDVTNIHSASGQVLISSFSMRLIDYPAYAQALIAGVSYNKEVDNARKDRELEKAKQSGGEPRL